MRFTLPPDWSSGRPPRDWPRIMACDVGGATPWAFEIAALDPWGNLLFYNEVYRATTDVDWLADQVKPLLVDINKEPYNWIARVIDYENKLAAEDLRRRGVHFTNAQKMGKAHSVQRLSGYLHPNPKHHYPVWHPLAGQPNSPRAFFLLGGPNAPVNLVREVPQQRWKEAVGEDGRLKNEPDRTVSNHGWDCALYIVRELPDPATLAAVPAPENAPPLSKQSELYYAMVKAHDEELARSHRESGVRRIVLPTC